jgi:hypothetical protein
MRHFPGSVAFAVPALASLLLAACNGGTGSGDGDAPFTAKVDGEPWAAVAISITANALGTPGSVLFQGTDAASDGSSRSLTLTVYNISGPGTYPLGVSETGFGGDASYGAGEGGSGQGQIWGTPGTGLDGEITFTAFGAGRIAGSFRFTATPGRNNTVGGTREITDGKFDLALTGNLRPVPANAGSRLSAKLDGKPFNAASIPLPSLMDILGGQGLQVSASSSENIINLQLTDAPGAGVYALSNMTPSRGITVGRNTPVTSPCCWGSTGVPDSGSVEITSLTADRVKGRFSGVLKPRSGSRATAPLVVTDGEFDLGIP